MSQPAKNTPSIQKPVQIRALASPARQEIVDILESAGPSTIARLAELMGRPADALYFHVRKLLKVGLVVERERHRDGRHVSVVYDLAWRPMRLSYATPAKPRDISRVVTSALRLAARDFSRGIESGDAVIEGPRRTVWGARAKGWLTATEVARVNELLAEAAAIVRTATPRPGTQTMSVSFVLAPVRVSPRARASAAVNKKSTPQSGA